ncbi:MAG: GTP-binding protein [Asgard group archaeon]|nr:GTP-binding protein [Asgard group archaeon]
MLGSVVTRKIVVLGDPSVGKTSIIKRYVHNQFEENYVATLGFNIYTRYIDISEKQVGLSIWDIGGQEAFKMFAFKYLIEADAAIFVADVTKPDSISSLEKWNERLDKVINRQIPKIVLFNKIDLDYNMENVSNQVAQSDIRTEFNGIVFASAKTGQNIVDIFSMLANLLTNWEEEFGIINKKTVNVDGVFDDKNLPILFFSGDDCSLCPPTFDNIAKLTAEFPLSIKLINVDTSGEMAKKYGIFSLPTVIIGNTTVVGNSSKEMLRLIISDEYNRFFSLKD